MTRLLAFAGAHVASYAVGHLAARALTYRTTSHPRSTR